MWNRRGQHRRGSAGVSEGVDVINSHNLHNSHVNREGLRRQPFLLFSLHIESGRRPAGQKPLADEDATSDEADDSAMRLYRMLTFFESVRHTMKVAGETLKSPYWPGVIIRRYGYNVKFSANINACSMRMDNRHSGEFFIEIALPVFDERRMRQRRNHLPERAQVTTVGSAIVPEPCFFTESYHQKADGCFFR